MNRTLLVPVLLAFSTCVGPMFQEQVTPIDALLVLPVSVNLTTGFTSQLSAQRFKDGESTDRTGTARWSSANQRVVTVSSGGLVTAVGPGQTTITGEVDGASAVAQVVVTAPPFQILPVAVSLSWLSLPDGGIEASSRRLTAVTWSGTSQTDVTDRVLWGTSNAAVALVSDAGVVSAIEPGGATVTALLGSDTTTVEIIVKDVTPVE